MSIARHVSITGVVQGVFFRAWTRDQALQLEVAGWVRNCADGSVEAHVEGEEAVVERMLRLLERGPAGARVDRVECEAAPVEGYEGFGIRR